MIRFTLGTHNLHDSAGVPTMFADVVLFTEAVPTTVRGRLARGARVTGARVTGRRVLVCADQRDLVVVLRRSVFTGPFTTSYVQYVNGWAGVTPHRGTFTVYGFLRATGESVAINAEHRINAAFKPWVRGEREFREAAWEKHTAGTLATMGTQAANGHLVLAGGDVNTPEGVRAYPVLDGVHERGVRFDRVAVLSRSRVQAGRAEYLTAKGSDHPRLRVTVGVGDAG